MYSTEIWSISNRFLYTLNWMAVLCTSCKEWNDVIVNDLSAFAIEWMHSDLMNW